MEPQYWIQAGLTFILVAITAIYAWRTHKISQSSDRAAKATMEQAEATVALASREYVKEFIRLEIYPLLERCSKVKRILQTNYFAPGLTGDLNYKTGWPERYGGAPELSKEEAKVLKIGVFNGGEVFSFPDPSLGILQGRLYSPPDMNVLLRLQDLRDKHKEVADRIAGFDSKLPRLNKLLRSIAVEVKKIVTPYISNLETKKPLVVHSELDKGRVFSYIAEICFNYLLLMPRDFDAFFKQFERDQAKNFWEENKSDLKALLSKESVDEKINQLKELSNRFFKEVSQIYDSLQACENSYRSKCYITFEELPPLPF